MIGVGADFNVKCQQDQTLDVCMKETYRHSEPRNDWKNERTKCINAGFYVYMKRRRDTGSLDADRRHKTKCVGSKHEEQIHCSSV